MGTRWLIEGEVDERWPINTRANIGEVFPEVLTPLTHNICLLPVERGWRQSFEAMGVMHKDDIPRKEPVLVEVYGGYGYLNLSYLRMAGVRAPGSSAEAIDVSLFGEGDPPPYSPAPGDKRFTSTLKMIKYVMGVLNTKSEPSFVDDARRTLKEWLAVVPSLDVSDEELLDVMYRFADYLQPMFKGHMQGTLTGGILTGILADAAVAAGRPELLTDLTAAMGEVHSAQPSDVLGEVAALAAAEPKVAAAFDEGVEGIAERLAALPEAAAFNEAFDGFIAQFGHRGPSDWELSSRTWENTPELAYAAVDVMRAAPQSDGDGDAGRVGDPEAKREAAAELIRPHLGFMDKMNFNKALQAIRHYVRAREATRDLCIQAFLPPRQAFFELARRAAERGGVQELRDVALLHPRDELPQYLQDPAAWVDTLAERAALRDRFIAVEPPFFVTRQQDVPTLEELEAVAAEVAAAAPVEAGTVLQGNPGSAGVARGRARVVRDSMDPGGLEPGDILVAPLTDPTWTPLFVPAAGVVVDVGALMSHSVVVARELGIPCVVAVGDGSERIPDGAMIEVNGTTGEVTVLELAPA